MEIGAGQWSSAQLCWMSRLLQPEDRQRRTELTYKEIHTNVVLFFIEFYFLCTLEWTFNQHFDVCRHRHVHTNLTFTLASVYTPGVLLPPLVQHMQSGSSRASAIVWSCFFVWRSGKVLFNKGKIKKRHTVRRLWDAPVYNFFLQNYSMKNCFPFLLSCVLRKPAGNKTPLPHFFSASLIAFILFCTPLYD